MYALLLAIGIGTKTYFIEPFRNSKKVLHNIDLAYDQHASRHDTSYKTPRCR